MKRIFFCLPIVLLFSFCSIRKSATVDQLDTDSISVMNEDSRFSPNEFEENYNKCFSIENGYEDFYYSDTIVYKTKNHNFFKKISISDNKFIWVIERELASYVIDTFPCTRDVESLVDWETDEFVALKKTCGSYCWTNILVPVYSKGKELIYLSYSAIDFDNMNVVSIAEGYFIIKNLYTLKEIKFPVRKIDCIDTFDLFSVDNIAIKGSLVSYQLKCKDGSVIEETIEVSLIDLVEKK